MKAFFDIDTQIDFLFPAGALYGQGGERLIGPVAALNHHAAARGIPLISSTCAHGENSAEFRHWPPHCVKGTIGQQKPAALLLPNRITIPNEASNLDSRGADQILIEKDDLDLFTNPNLLTVLERLGIEECIVYGAFTEYCVNCAITGLLRTGRKVSLVKDAVAALDADKGLATLQAFSAAGGTLVTMTELLSSS